MKSVPIGLAVVGCGTVGRIRAGLAMEHPSVEWLGLCDIDEETGEGLTRDTGADYFTTNVEELVSRPEVTAVIVATEESEHVGPIMAAVETSKSMLIEKPLATDPVESKRVLATIEASGVDAVVGYTQRFRRRFQAAKQRIADGQIGEVTSVVARAFMNRMVPEATLRKTKDTRSLTPMVVSGTHSLDLCMWLMQPRQPVEVYARSTDRTLGELGTDDATFGVFTMDDGTIWSMNISWALPSVWPGAVYGIEVGIVGTKGVIDIEDTHRDVVMATEIAQPAGYASRGYQPCPARHVDFLGSYPPGDLAAGMIWGPMREETMTWFNRLARCLDTPHATVQDAHNYLMLTMAMDRSARTGQAVPLPLQAEDL